MPVTENNSRNGSFALSISQIGASIAENAGGVLSAAQAIVEAAKLRFNMQSEQIISIAKSAEALQQAFEHAGVVALSRVNEKHLAPILSSSRTVLGRDIQRPTSMLEAETMYLKAMREGKNTLIVLGPNCQSDFFRARIQSLGGRRRSATIDDAIVMGDTTRVPAFFRDNAAVISSGGKPRDAMPRIVILGDSYKSGIGRAFGESVKRIAKVRASSLSRSFIFRLADPVNAAGVLDYGTNVSHEIARLDRKVDSGKKIETRLYYTYSVG